ncbi:hypothetical protein HRbin30_02509 [bacterium HR30]|nr:hypothetical protein HRbin30_02509 [bacterium HR30]
MLTAVTSTGSRGCPGGGHAPIQRAFTTKKALTKPAKNITSLARNSAIPRTALGTPRLPCPLCVGATTVDTEKTPINGARPQVERGEHAASFALPAPGRPAPLQQKEAP